MREPNSGVITLLDETARQSEGLRYSFRKSIDKLSPTQSVRFAALGLFDGPYQPRSLVERVLSAIPENADASHSAHSDLAYLARYSLATFLIPATSTSRHRCDRCDRCDRCR